MTPVDAEVPEGVVETLKETLSDLFAPEHKVADVCAEGMEGWNGDALVKITIVFEDLPGEDGVPDAGKLTEIVERILPVLEEAGDTRWPFWSIATKEEMLREAA